MSNSTSSHFNNVSVQKTVRSAAILTDTYVAGTVIDTEWRFNQLVLLVSFTKGSLTSGEIKVEFSHDNTNFFQETAGSTTTGVTTVSNASYTWTDDGNKYITIPFKARHIKISAKGTGTMTGSSMAIAAFLGNI